MGKGNRPHDQFAPGRLPLGDHSCSYKVRAMARRSLRPHLNQIRSWVRQGRTDAWIAHQLEATVQQIEAFKKDNDLAPADTENAEAVGADFDDEIDLRAEDDALVAAELEAAEARRLEEEAAEAARQAEEAARKAEDEDGDETDEADAKRAPRRRGRRGGRGRSRAAAGVLEGTFDHGEEGYGLWLDPAVTDNPVYAEHWAGHRPVEVTIEEDQIVIRRAGVDGD
ncbi:MAG TPA: hypothetical protein VG474_01170 [Solirubrobacteraceae bacterium]|nr:hypothetical protein [Solirubrobacteraceae bacterium]